MELKLDGQVAIVTGEAARLLGISKETLRYRIEKFDLSQVSSRTIGSGLQDRSSLRFKDPHLLN